MKELFKKQREVREAEERVKKYKAITTYFYDEIQVQQGNVENGDVGNEDYEYDKDVQKFVLQNSADTAE